MPRGNVLLAALSLSAVVACSDPQAGTLPTVSPTPSTSSPSTPTATPSTDLASSLRAALQTYFDALYAAGMDPANKTDALAALIAPSCTCYRAVEVLRDEGRKGRYIDYTYTLKDVSVVDVDHRGGDVRYTVLRSAGAERERSGRVLERYPPTTQKYSAHFTRDNESWLLERVVLFS